MKKISFLSNNILRSCCIYSAYTVEDLAYIHMSILSQMKFTDIDRVDIKIFVPEEMALEAESLFSGIEIVGMKTWFSRYSVIAHPSLSQYKYVFSMANNLHCESINSNFYKQLADLNIATVGLPVSDSSPKDKLEEHMYTFTECRDRNEYLHGFATSLNISISETVQRICGWFDGWFYICNRQFFDTSEWISLLDYCENIKNYSDETVMQMYVGNKVRKIKYTTPFSLCKSEEERQRIVQSLTPWFYHRHLSKKGWNNIEKVHLDRIDKFNPRFDYKGWLHNIGEAYQECQDKKVVLKSRPIYLDIELRNECNFHCIHCNSAMYKRGAALSEEVINDLMKLVPYVEIIELSKIAEPFFYPEGTLAFIKRVRKLNPIIVFRATTNGSLLTEDVINSLIDSDFESLTVSLDSDNKEGFEFFRKKSNFEQVVGNLHKLREIKEQRKSRLPTLHVSCIANSMAHLPGVMNICNEVGANSAFFGPPMIFRKNEEVHNLTKYTRDYYSSHHDELINQLDESMNLAEKFGIALTHGMFEGIDARSSKRMTPKPEPLLAPTISGHYDFEAVCPTEDPWYRHCVLPDGSLSPCCYHTPHSSIDDSLSGNMNSRNHIFLQNLRLLLKNGQKGACCMCTTKDNFSAAVTNGVTRLIQLKVQGRV